MPGDPLRAKFIAETFLTGREAGEQRPGRPGLHRHLSGHACVSVMASGMGMPSIGIYSHELFHFYDVENIIRVGSAGAISRQAEAAGRGGRPGRLHQLQLRRTSSAWAAPSPPSRTSTLLETAVTVARELGVGCPMWATSCSAPTCSTTRRATLMDWGKMGVLAVEMESAALYCNAAEARQAGPGHLYHLRQLDYRRGAACRRPPDHLHPDDGDRPGRCCGDGEEVRRVQKRRIRPRGHAGEA